MRGENGRDGGRGAKVMTGCGMGELSLGCDSEPEEERDGVI